MRNSLILLTVAVLLIVGVVLVIQMNSSEPIIRIGGSGVTPTPAAADGGDSTVSPTSMRSDNIIVTAPQAGSNVSSPFVVRGEARTFENNVVLRLTEQGGRVLVEDFTTAQSPDIGQFGPFEMEISYPATTQSSATLEVFQYSARDGSEIDKVTIPLTLQANENLTVNVYFNNTIQGTECEQVVPTSRQIPRAQQTARAALEELLKGPTETETTRGFITSIPSGVQIQRLVIENRTAIVDFDETLQSQVGGSCRVAAIRAQITQTLRQFDTVDQVVISINGRTDDILQP